MHNAIKPNHVLWIFTLIALVWFSTLDYRKLVRPDEGRYAEIPREMLATGNWVTPRLDGIKYFEKPALQYWMTAAGYAVFGEHAWTARLWGALTGFLGILMVYRTGRRIYDPGTGLHAALALAGSLLYSVIGHINTLDMGVTFFMCLSLCGFLIAQQDDADARENRIWMHVAWAAMGFSILSKGLIGVVLPGAVVVLYSLVQRDLSVWKKMHFLTGVPLMLAVSAPWFVLVCRENPEFFHFFFIHEHFERFLTKAHGRYHPWGYFIPILLAGMLPWTVTLFPALADALKSGPGKFQSARFLLIWSAFIYFFFSISDSKLPSYILPIFPALALLIGRRLASGAPFSWHALPTLLVGAAGLFLAPQVVKFADPIVPRALYEHYIPWLEGAAALALAGSAAAIFLERQKRRSAAVFALAFSMLASGQAIMLGHDSLAPANSAYDLARDIKPYLKPGIPFYSVQMYEQTLPFYIKRTVTLVDYQDELAFGISVEPDKWIPDMKTFETAWKRDGEALAIMNPETYDRLKGELPMQVIARDTRRVVVKKP